MPVIDVPTKMQRLDKNKAGYLIPWFVWRPEDGEPDFRVIGYGKVEQAWNDNLCWVCGNLITSQYRAFVVGPMCAVNRVSAEPPSHIECAIYSATVCPFLANPTMVRRDRGLPAHHGPPGVMIPDNPGVALVWVSKRSKIEPFDANGTGTLFDMGPASSVAWFAHGRPATRQEVLDAFEKGLPKLRVPAEAEGTLDRLEVAIQAAMELVPAEEVRTRA